LYAGNWIHGNNGNSKGQPGYTQPFNGPFSGTIRASQYQKGKTNLDFTEARDSEWQWHQLGHMQVCTSLQTDNHARTPPLRATRLSATKMANKKNKKIGNFAITGSSFSLKPQVSTLLGV